MPFPWRPGMLLTDERMNAGRPQMVLQEADLTMTSQTTLLDTDIVLPGVALATYTYQLLISLSAVQGANSGLAAAWSVPSGTSINRFTTSMAPANPPTSLNSGGVVIMRRPAAGTLQLAAGSDGSSPPTNFHSAYDIGTVTMGGVDGDLRWRVSQSGTGSTDATILRGGPTHTRLIYQRIA